MEIGPIITIGASVFTVISGIIGALIRLVFWISEKITGLDLSIKNLEKAINGMPKTVDNLEIKTDEIVKDVDEQKDNWKNLHEWRSDIELAVGRLQKTRVHRRP